MQLLCFSLRGTKMEGSFLYDVFDWLPFTLFSQSHCAYLTMEISVVTVSRKCGRQNFAKVILFVVFVAVV